MYTYTRKVQIENKELRNISNFRLTRLTFARIDLRIRIEPLSFRPCRFISQSTLRRRDGRMNFAIDLAEIEIKLYICEKILLFYNADIIILHYVTLFYYIIGFFQREFSSHWRNARSAPPRVNDTLPSVLLDRDSASY